MLMILHCFLSTLQGSAVQALVMWHTAWLPGRLREWTVGIDQSWVSSLHWSCIQSMLTAQRLRKRSTCPGLVRAIISVSGIIKVTQWASKTFILLDLVPGLCVHLCCSSWRNPGLLRLDRAKSWQWSWQYGNQSQIQLIQWHLRHQWSKDLVATVETAFFKAHHWLSTDFQSWMKNWLVSIV